MYPIIKKFFEDEGYSVKAEVLDADLVAMKEDIVMIVEMKTSFNTKLIYQGIKGKKITDYVYLAIPKPNNKILKSDIFKEKLEIVKSLELGMMLVDERIEEVLVLFDPTMYLRKPNNKKKQRLKKEFLLRKTSLNYGGVSRTKIITSYRELSLLTLYFLKDNPKTTKEIKEFTKQEKVMSVLQKNYYGWFERVERGIYRITNVGKEALVTYEKVIQQLINK